MNFETNFSILFSDTLLPDIFISEYMPSLDGQCIKIYLYSLFLVKNNKKVSIGELSKILQIEYNKVKESLTFLQDLNLISWKDNKIIINDIKEAEVKKVYRMKYTSSPDEAIKSTERNKRRNSLMASINNTFFQGVMSPSWYTDIDSWFDRYKFDEDVMMYLFRHCYDLDKFNKHYMLKVAENWYNRNIQNVFELEKYFEEFKKFSDIKKIIIKKLKLYRSLTEYEEKYIEKWTMEFKYKFDIIEIALKMTTSKSNPSLKYVDKIISDWHENNLTTVSEVENYIKIKRTNNYNNKNKNNYYNQKPVQSTNFDQRVYDDEFFESLYDNFKT
jgi:DnaD/phage-associated family protein